MASRMRKAIQLWGGLSRFRTAPISFRKITTEAEAVKGTGSAKESKSSQADKNSGNEKRDDGKSKKSGIPWGQISFNIGLPLFFYWLYKRRVREPVEKHMESQISIHRPEMAYLIDKTQFKAQHLYWIKTYAEKYFPDGTALPDQWGKFVSWILRELNMHREGSGGSLSDGMNLAEMKLEPYDILSLYRLSPSLAAATANATKNATAKGTAKGRAAGTTGGSDARGTDQARIDLEELLAGLSVLAIDEVVVTEAEPEKNVKQKIKTDPWAKFDLAWNLVDHDKDGELNFSEFSTFCGRLIRFGYFRADYLTEQTTALPQFPPTFGPLDGHKLADIYWNGLGLGPNDSISRKAFESETSSLLTIDRLYIWHIEDDTGFFRGKYNKYDELWKRYQRRKKFEEEGRV